MGTLPPRPHPEPCPRDAESAWFEADPFHQPTVPGSRATLPCPPPLAPGLGAGRAPELLHGVR